MIEWVLELSHIQPGLHHILHGPRSARMGLVAITMIVVGHVTEHFHHEHEHEAEREREQEDNIRIQALEDRIAELEGFQVDLEAKEKALEQEVDVQEEKQHQLEEEVQQLERKALRKAVSSHRTIHVRRPSPRRPSAFAQPDLTRAKNPFGGSQVGGLEGELEEEPRLKALLARFGTVLVATVRYRREPATDSSPAKVSWALCTFSTPAEADAAIAGSGSLGVANLVTRQLDLEQALGSTGSMGAVALKHRDELDALDMEEAFDQAHN